MTRWGFPLFATFASTHSFPGVSFAVIPIIPRLAFLLRGIGRFQGASHRRRIRQPVSIADPARVISCVGASRSGYDACMLSAALLTAFFGLLRASEYTCPAPHVYSARAALMVSDVSIDWHNRILRVNIRVSKTDPFMTGAVVIISAIGGQLCPFRAMVTYLHARGRPSGPLFMFRNGSSSSGMTSLELSAQRCPLAQSALTHCVEGVPLHWPPWVSPLM